MRRKFYLKVVFVLALLSWTFHSYGQGTHKARPLGTTAAPYGYYEYLPLDYSQNNNKYPLLISLHGLGQLGNGTTQLPAVIKSGPGREVENGRDFPFVILSAQTPVWWNSAVLNIFIDYAIKTYRIDPTRVYITGLSMGAVATFDYASKYPEKVAAMVPISGNGAHLDACKFSSVPLWAFHGLADSRVLPYGSILAVKNYNKCSPKPNPKAKLTLYPDVGHDAWTRTYDGSAGHNIYSWMLQFKKGSSNANPNKAPNVSAGADKAITLPKNSLTLSGYASDPDGTVVSYNWTKISGPSVDMSGTSTKKLRLKNMVAGTYIFRFVARDNDGAQNADEVKVVVNPAPSNQPPIAHAGTDKTITLPVKKYVISGWAEDKDGFLMRYRWTKVSGPNVTMRGEYTANVKLSNLEAGTYVFRFAATDNKGATATDDMKLVVQPTQSNGNASSITAHAGTDKTVTLPINTVFLYGRADLVNCKIQSYSWTKVSGPSVKMLGYNTANLNLSYLSEGTYTFRFTATNNLGISSSDDVILKVLGSGKQSDNNKESGVTYHYYEFDPTNAWSKLPDFTSIKPKKSGISSDISLALRERDDYFAMVFEGYITIQNAGEYFFYTSSDDGSKVYIDNKLVVNNDGLHPKIVKYNNVSLSSGKHRIRIEYFERTGNENLYVSYKGPGVELQSISASALTDEANYKSGLAYAYYENAEASQNAWFKLPDFSKLTPKKTGTLADFSLWPKERDSHYGFVFDGFINIEKAGTYSFFSNSDDGSKLFINGKQVVDNDGWHAARERSGKVYLPEGYHAIKVIFYEHEGGETLEVKWQGPGISKAIVPHSVLFHTPTNIKALQSTASYESGPKSVDSLQEQDGNLSVTLYPNPATNLINIKMAGSEGENVSFAIVDVSGRRVYSQRVNIIEGDTLTQLDLNSLGLTKGMYLLQLYKGDEKIQTMRFIKL